jgi:IclR family KDG regulon transcriptional repressor
MSASKSVTESQPVPALVRGAKILELLSLQAPLTMDQIYGRTRIPRTTVFRILTTFEALGYVKREHIHAVAHWSLGLGLLSLTNSVLRQLDLRKQVRRIMEDLAENTDEFVQLGVLYNDKVMYVDHVKRPKPLTMYAEVGSQLPINISPAGMVLAAFLEADRLDELLRKQTFPKNTPNTITDPGELRELLRQIARQGYAVDDQQYAAGIRCVAAPIYDYTGRVIAALNVIGSLLSITEDRIGQLVEIVKHSATEASRQMGYRPS